MLIKLHHKFGGCQYLTITWKYNLNLKRRRDRCRKHICTNCMNTPVYIHGLFERLHRIIFFLSYFSVARIASSHTHSNKYFIERNVIAVFFYIYIKNTVGMWNELKLRVWEERRKKRSQGMYSTIYCIETVRIWIHA